MITVRLGCRPRLNPLNGKLPLQAAHSLPMDLNNSGTCALNASSRHVETGSLNRSCNAPYLLMLFVLFNATK